MNNDFGYISNDYNLGYNMEYRDKEEGIQYPIYKGESLDFDTVERIREGLKKYYSLTTFFGAFFFFGVTISAINFIVGVLTDNAFNEGAFVYPIAKIIMIVVTIPFFLLFMYLTSKLLLLGKKYTDYLTKNDFWWREGQISSIEIHKHRTDNRTRISYTYKADGEECEILERRVEKGDRVIVVYLGAETQNGTNKCMKFAITTENKINE